MNEEAKRRWVEALRSDKYEQVIGKLYGGRNGTVKCCAVGVLNDVSGIGRWDDDGLYVVDAEKYARDENIFEKYFLEDVWGDCVFEHMDEHEELQKFVQGHWEDAEVVPPSPEDVEKMSEFVYQIYVSCFRGEEEFAHWAVAKWAGLDEIDPSLKVNGELVEIHELNDGKKGEEGWLTFSELADLIEEQL